MSASPAAALGVHRPDLKRVANHRVRRRGAMAPIEAAFRVASTDAAYTQAEAPIDLDALNLFLRDSRAIALDPNGEPVTLVMGNEAADLDSIVSAITYALHVTRRSCIDYEWMDRDPPDPVTGDFGGWNNEKESQCELRFAVPYVACAREDLPLRGDAAWLLDDIGVDVDSIVFADDLDPMALDASGRLRDVVLVDHNVPPAKHRELLGKTTRVIDHHVDEELYPLECDVMIGPVGSCATLIAEQASEEAEIGIDGMLGHGYKGNARGLWAGPLAKMIAAAILVDTQNLDVNNERTRMEDYVWCHRLAAFAGYEDVEAMTSLYETLKRKRFDQSGLSPRDLLRRDYKQWTLGDDVRVGIASFGVALNAMGDAGVVKATCDAFMRDRGVHVLVLMSAFEGEDGSFKRQLGFTSLDDENAQLCEKMATAIGDGLGGLRTIEGAGGAFGAMAFHQGDAKASRKKVQPLLAEFLEAEKAAADGVG